MGKYRGLNITGGLKSNFKKIIVRKTVDEIEFTDRGEIIGTPSDLPTRGAGHRRNRNNFNRIGARGRTRGTVDYGVISGPESIVIQEHDYGSVSTWATTINDAAFETRRALGKAASIVDEENAVAPTAATPGSVFLYNSTGIIPAGTPLILNEDGTVSAVTGGSYQGAGLSTTYNNPNPSGDLGRSASISDTYVAGVDANSGTVSIFNRETGTHIRTHTKSADSSERWGWYVDNSDDYVVVGDASPDYSRQVLDVWRLSDGASMTTIYHPTNGNNMFPGRVAIYGNYILAGAYQGVDENNINTGAYLWNAQNGSLLRAYSRDIADVFHFGRAVTLNSTKAFVWSPRWYPQSLGYDEVPAKVHVYTFTSNNAIARYEIPWFGGSSQAEMDCDETHLIIGGGGNGFIMDIATGNLVHQLIPPDGEASSSFASDVSIDGDYAAVRGNGKVFVYDVTTGNLLSTIEDPDGNALTFYEQVIRARSNGDILVANRTAADGGKLYKFTIGEIQTTNLTADNYIGFAGSEFSYDGALGQVITGGGVVTGLSGLVTGTDYYVQNDGSIDTTVTDVFAGTATSPTTLELPVPIIPISWGGDRAVTMGGSVPYRGTIVAHVDYFDITNPNNNAAGFGSLAVEHEYGTNTAVSNRVRAVTAGGRNYNDSGNYVYIRDIQYITISLLGSAGDFGDLYSSGGRFNMMGVSDGTYGLFAGGTGASSSSYKGIHKITIATGGSSSSSNSLSTQRISGAGFSDGTYGFFAGGYVSGSGALRSIDYRVISTGGSVSNFGNLMAYSGSEEISACSNATYGVIFGGRQVGGSDTGARGVIYSNAMEYVTMATQGDATDFGTLPVGVNQSAAMSNPTTGVRAGGVYNGSNSNVIEYWQFDTPGSAQDFGNLVQSRKGHAGTAGDPS